MRRRLIQQGQGGVDAVGQVQLREQRTASLGEVRAPLRHRAYVDRVPPCILPILTALNLLLRHPALLE
jgi:hypothetical protein